MEATKKKMGRPVIGEPKTIEIKCRIDKLLNEKVVSYCEKNKISRSEFLREAITEKIHK